MSKSREIECILLQLPLLPLLISPIMSCSKAFLNELTGFPLRIAEPDLFKHLTYQSIVHFDTPHHLNICRKFGKLDAAIGSDRG